MTESADVAAHYATGSLLRKIEAGLRAQGIAPPVPLDALAPVDEFHIGGRKATEPFLDRLGLGAGQRLLDLGCGLGGPARFAAQRTGARRDPGGRGRSAGPAGPQHGYRVNHQRHPDHREGDHLGPPERLAEHEHGNQKDHRRRDVLHDADG